MKKSKSDIEIPDYHTFVNKNIIRWLPLEVTIFVNKSVSGKKYMMIYEQSFNRNYTIKGENEKYRS